MHFSSGNNERGASTLRIVLIGPPASGKGTQAEWLSQELGLTTISTGALLRDEMASKSSLGVEADTYLSRGELLPDHLIIGVVEHWLSQHDGGFVLDGFPRTSPQAEALDAVLSGRGRALDAAIFLDTPEEVLEARIAGRRQCSECGHIHKIGGRIANESDACPDCGGSLYRRDDDTAETLRSRLVEYRKKTLPVVSYYQERKILLRIRGDHPEDVVSNKILAALEVRGESIREKS